MRGGGSKIGQFMKQKKKNLKSTLLADNTELITTKQTKPGPVASAAPHPITPEKEKGGGGLSI